jgi:riboflavin transporter FmnP
MPVQSSLLLLQELTVDVHTLCTLTGVLLMGFAAGFVVGLLADWDCLWVCSII